MLLVKKPQSRVMSLKHNMVTVHVQKGERTEDSNRFY